MLDKEEMMDIDIPKFCHEQTHDHEIGRSDAPAATDTPMSDTTTSTFCIALLRQ